MTKYKIKILIQVKVEVKVKKSRLRRRVTFKGGSVRQKVTFSNGRNDRYNSNCGLRIGNEKEGHIQRRLLTGGR